MTIDLPPGKFGVVYAEAHYDTMTLADIAAALGEARQEGNSWRCRCPVCGKNNLTLSNRQRRLLVKCWTGCNAYGELNKRGFIGKVARETPEEAAARCAFEIAERKRRIAIARYLWSDSHPATDSLVEVYLWSRLLIDPIPPVIRMLGLQHHKESGSQYPAMIARVDHAQTGFSAVLLTYINPLDPSVRVTVDPRKRAIGSVKGAAVRLAEAGPTLAIAEGIETAASVQRLYQIPVWAALSASGIESVVVPPMVQELIIAADNDPRGLEAAHRAAWRWHACGKTVRLIHPPTAKRDFNDVLRGI
jgi:putative DNA primase/helicase